MNTEMTNKEKRKVIQDLRMDGYAIIVWTPEQLEDIDPRILEQKSISFGQETIDGLFTKADKCRETKV